MAKTPNIRFKGFTEEWKETVLKDIGYAISGMGFPEACQGGELGTPFFKVSDMNNKGNELIMNTANNYVTEGQIKQYRWKVINEVPAIFFAKVGAAVLLNRKRLVLSPALCDNNTMMFSINRDICDTFFAKYLFDNIYLPALVQVGTLPSYNGSQVEACHVYIPGVQEQEKVSSLFKTLDTTISLRESELEKLKNIKRAFLEKLFPQNGQTSPAIRFKGFERDWDEKLIGDLFKERDERSGEGELLSVTISSGVRRATDMVRTFNVGDLNKYKVVRVGDIAYNTMRMWQGACGASNYSGIVSPAYTIATPLKEQYAPFYAYYFKTSQLLHDFRVYSQGMTSDTWNLKYPIFARIKLFVPTEDEQKKIGQLIEKLETILSLRERQLTLLKHTKQALLEQMFVNE